MADFYNAEAPKKPTNVSINSDLLSQARSLKINLSATLEQALIEQLRAQRRAQWRQENASAIQAYNDHVEKNGTFSDSARKF
ncbi:MAG: type II toxin-antitoxin system CcdA family antitoxin [Pseudomonadota bacterium]|nr:type II toxin-antitoxin system CcdA family antitoxin [Pseudomonadota bacterium]